MKFVAILYSGAKLILFSQKYSQSMKLGGNAVSCSIWDSLRCLLFAVLILTIWVNETFGRIHCLTGPLLRNHLARNEGNSCLTAFRNTVLIYFLGFAILVMF